MAGHPARYVLPTAPTINPDELPQPSSAARMVFREVTRTLRQNMPLIPVKLPTHQNAAVYLQDVLSQWASIVNLDGPDRQVRSRRRLN